MAPRGRTFGGVLKSFADFAPQIDSETFDSLRKVIQQYVEAAFQFRIFDMLLSQDVDQGPGLSPAWGPRRSYRLHERNGEGFAGLCAYCFERRRPIWVVSESKDPLHSVQDIVDLWSNLKNLPAYLDIDGEPNRTLVSVPLSKGGRTVGVFNLESTRHFTPTRAAKEEIRRICAATHSLYLRSQDILAKRHTTEDTIDGMRAMLHDPRIIHQFSKPKIFCASAHRANDEVLGLIRQTLGEYLEQVDSDFWQDNPDSGSINQQIFKRIDECSHGICYFSAPVEPSGAGEPRFYDTPSVLFEAGLIQGQSPNPTSPYLNWIPIREKNSPPAPFDISVLRTLIVPRDREGKLNREQFRDELRKRLDALLKH